MNRPTTPVLADSNAAKPWLNCLPPYSRSLLKIKVPVTVTLASTKQSVGQIMELIPGTILQFEKMCDEPLGLEVGGQRVAEGETVKVGDKFGLRVTSIVLPDERFARVVSQASGTTSADDQSAGAEDS